MVKLRLESNADADSIDESGLTPLSWAVDGHNTALAAILIEKGAALNSKDKDGRTPLSWAADDGFMVKLLVEKGADVHAADKHGRTPLSWAATGGFHYSAVNLLLDHGAEPNSRDNNGDHHCYGPRWRERVAMIAIRWFKSYSKEH